MRVIDAHQHYWRTAAQEQPWRHEDHAQLARDFEPDELVPQLAAQNIDGTVLVQSVDEPAENDRLARYAAEPSVHGVVSWLPLAEADSAMAELDRIVVPKHAGVRCLVGDDPLDWLADGAARTVFREIAARGLAWDVVPITGAQTRNILALAEAVPELSIVIDHLGRPPVETSGWNPWADNVAQLANHPNVSMKVSVGLNVLAAWDRWDADAVLPYVEHVASMFGPGRLMLASNWPVLLLRADHATAWRDMYGLVERLFTDPESRSQVLGRTATAVYGLDRFTVTGR